MYAHIFLASNARTHPNIAASAYTAARQYCAYSYIAAILLIAIAALARPAGELTAVLASESMTHNAFTFFVRRHFGSAHSPWRPALPARAVTRAPVAHVRLFTDGARVGLGGPASKRILAHAATHLHRRFVEEK